MNVAEHGIEAVIGEDGVLDLKTTKPMRVRLNGRMLNGVTGHDLGAAQAQAVSQKFWNPDGTQGDSTIDLRGEHR